MATYTKSVTSTLVPFQILGDVMPKVTTTLVPTQTIVRVLPQVTTTLVFTHTIRCGLKLGEVKTILDPTQIISTDDSILDENESIEEIATFTEVLTLAKTSTKSISTTLSPSQNAFGTVDNEHTWV